MTKDTGGPAFPSQDSVSLGDMKLRGESGMTLRDYFAAKAMQGFAADPENPQSTVEEMARYAYKWADAMLAERAK